MSGWVWLLLVTSIAAAIACPVWKRRLAARAMDGTFRYLVAESAGDLATPLAVVTLAFVCLAGVVAVRDSDDTTVAAVRALEHAIRAAYRATRALKIGRVGSLGLALAVALAGFVLRYRGWRRAAARIDRAYSWLDRYQKAVRWATTVATAVSWYTFFSNQSVALAGRLQLRAKTADAEYQRFVARVTAAVEADASTRVAERAQQEAPAAYRQATETWSADRNAREELVRDYPNLTRRFRFSWDPAERFRTDATERAARLDELAEVVSSSGAGGRMPTPEGERAPPESTPRAIESQLAAFEAAAQTRLPDALEAFEGAAGKKIIPGMLGLVADPQRSDVLARLSAEVPLFGPLMDVFAGAATKYASSKVRARALALVNRALLRGNPPDPTEVAAEGAVFAEQLPVTWSHVQPRLLAELSASVAADRAKTDGLRSGLTQAAERARPAAEAQLRQENQTLAAGIRRDWPSVTEAPELHGPSEPLFVEPKLRGLAEAERVFRQGRWHYLPATRSSPRSPADQLIDAAEKAGDLWKANEILGAAARALREQETSAGRLRGLAGVTTKYMPESEAARSVAGQLARATASESPSMGHGRPLSGFHPGEPGIPRPGFHEEFHFRPEPIRPRIFFRR